MTATLIDGKAVAAQIREAIKNEVAQIFEQHQKRPGLAVILVGGDPASQVYVGHKRRACDEAGFHSVAHDLPADTAEETLLGLIDQLNADETIHGILVQLPLPPQFDTETVIERIAIKKDVDGFHPYNIGRLAVRLPLLRSCTPYGVIHLLNHINEPYKGRHAVIVGASNHVGRPMLLELLLAGATVTACHRFTNDLKAQVSRADILVVAVGKPGIVKGEWIKPGATVIDVGINRTEEGKLIGDVDFDTAKTRAGHITPVPGGVGPMTVAILLKNTLQAMQLTPKFDSQKPKLSKPDSV